MYLRANLCAHINVTKICVYNEAICDTYETCFFERYSLKPTSTTCWQAVRIPENQDFMTLVCHHSNRDIAQPLIGIWETDVTFNPDWLVAPKHMITKDQVVSI